ncbi:hypothetical protein O3P69_012993 [Scylla paramamosain]|uniref:BTB domain-containing protein n=1 Tax=Scylla paramamosain TaxID=85552 RepID=A0AAW0TS51_SCYPA
MAASLEHGSVFLLEDEDRPIQDMTPPFSDEEAEDVMVWVGMMEEQVFRQEHIQIIQTLRKLGTHSDVCLVAGDGQHFMVHSFVLVTQSLVIQKFLDCNAGMGMMLLQLHEVSSKGLSLVLDFLYGFDLQLQQPDITLLLCAAHSLGITVLEGCPLLQQLKYTIRADDGGSSSSSRIDEAGSTVARCPTQQTPSLQGDEKPQDNLSAASGTGGS